MSVVAGARRFVRTTLTARAPDVAGRLLDGGFVLTARYLGPAVQLSDRGGLPRLQYRMVYDPSLNGFVESEANALAAAARAGVTVPALYGVDRDHARAAVAVEWVAGASLDAASASDIGAEAITTLVGLHARTRSAPGRRHALGERVAWWRGLLAGAAGTDQARAIVDACFDRLLARGSEIPAVVMHGDFVASNLVRRADRTLVPIDWELALTDGVPVVDLATFLLDGRRRGESRGAAFRRCFLEASGCAAAVEDYRHRIGLSDADARLLIGITQLKLVAEDLSYLGLHRGVSAYDSVDEDVAVLASWMARAA